MTVEPTTAAPAPTPALVERPAPRRRTPGGVVQHLAQTPPPPPGIGHPLLAANLTLAAGSLVHVTGMGAGWLAAAGAAASAVSAAVTRLSLGPTSGGIAAYTGLSSAAVCGWLAWAAHTSPWTPVSLGSLLLGTVTLGPWYGWLRRRRERLERQQAEIRALTRAQQKRHTWEEILAKAGARDVRVTSEEPFRAGFVLDLVLGPQAPDFRALASMAPTIERVAAYATALPIRAGSIQVERGKDGLAHQARLIVPTRDVLAETIECPDLDGPRSIHDPLVIGQYVDGSDVEVVFRSVHGMFAGMNDAGKSGQLNVHIAQLTQCVDAVTWYIAGNKAVRGLSPWLLPWLRGEAERPAFDWVAGDWDEAMRMLLDAYRAVDGRQAMYADGADKWEPSPEGPQINILIDEAPDLFAHPGVKTTHKGEKVTFSELVLKLMRLARSEAIQIIFLSQRGTATMIGPDGGDIKSQIVYRLGFRATGNMTDVNAVFNGDTAGIELSTLPNGAFYVELKGFARPRLAKGYWLDPERIKDFAIRNAQFCGSVDPETAALMEHYQERWTRDNQRQLLDTIAGKRRARLAGAAPVDTAQGEEGLVFDMGEIERMMPQLPRDLVDRARQAEERDQEVEQGRQDIARLQNNLDALTGETDALLEQIRAAYELPPISDEERNIRQPEVRPALPAGTASLLGLLASSDLLYAQDGWLPSKDVVAAVAKHLGWPDSSEGARRVADALRAVGIEAKRVSVDGDRFMGYNVAALRKAVRKHLGQ